MIYKDIYFNLYGKDKRYMINIGDHNQIPLFDPWSFLGEKCRKKLDESWAGLFQREIFPTLPVRELFPYFSSSNGRPTKDLYTVVGVLILQQAFDLTDEETVDQLAFNMQWHYALNIYTR
ncbi:MAG: transposase [Desulfamplus sp.]|nr:transposase [Desulfamplus sp.]